jgi:spore coat protein U-like protein
MLPRMRKLGLMLGLAFLCLAPRAARAQSCKNLGASGIVFPAYNVYAPADTTQAGTITYSCPPPLAPVVGLSASANGAYRPRQMVGGGGALNYELYVDAALTVVWGFGTDQQSLPTGNNKTASLFGRIFAGQDAAVGTYLDTIVVTFNF